MGKSLQNLSICDRVGAVAPWFCGRLVRLIPPLARWWCPPPNGPVTQGDTLRITEADIEALHRNIRTDWWLLKALGFVPSLWRQFKYSMTFRLLSRPFGVWLTRWSADRFRSIHPVPRGFGVALPLDASALRDALSRPEDFNGAESMSLRLPAGEVVLGIDWRRRHEEERARLEEALDCAPVADAARIRGIVRHRWNTVLGESALENVNLAQLFEDTALDVSERYLGIGAPDREEREHLRPIIRALASRVFQGPVRNSREDTFANLSADRMRSLVDRCVDEQRALLTANPALPLSAQSVTQRLLILVDKAAHGHGPDWLTQDWVVRNMITLSVFGSVTSARAMTQAVRQMLKNSARRKIGIQCAEEYAVAQATFGHQDSKVFEPKELAWARQSMRKVVFEAMRWHPMLSMLGVRTALRDTALAPGTDCMTHVPAGTKVLPMLLGAMHDPKVFPNPQRFCPFQRKAEDYLHFGAGPHECVGRRMAEVQMEELAFALFRHETVRTRTITCGKISYRGPAVVNLRLYSTP